MPQPPWRSQYLLWILKNDLDAVKSNKRLVFKEGGKAQAIEIKKTAAEGLKEKKAKQMAKTVES